MGEPGHQIAVKRFDRGPGHRVGAALLCPASIMQRKEALEGCRDLLRRRDHRDLKAGERGQLAQLATELVRAAARLDRFLASVGQAQVGADLVRGDIVLERLVFGEAPGQQGERRRVARQAVQLEDVER